MKQWLYKATDTETDAGRRRPDFETTRALIVTDKILCRGAFDRDRPRKANLVWRVVIGDLLHVYHRQYAEAQGVRFVGSFRVVDPGASRFDPACALARVDDIELAQRLREAYDIPPVATVTGWQLAPEIDAHEPDDQEQLKRFLGGQNSIVQYHPERAVRPASGGANGQPSGAPGIAKTRRAKDDVARDLIAWHFRIAPEITDIYRFFDEQEERDDEPIKLLEVSVEAAETGRVDTFGFDAAGDIIYPSAVAEITPHELELLRRGEIDLPPGWELSTAAHFRREQFLQAPAARAAS